MSTVDVLMPQVAPGKSVSTMRRGKERKRGCCRPRYDKDELPSSPFLGSVCIFQNDNKRNMLQLTAGAPGSGTRLIREMKKGTPFSMNNSEPHQYVLFPLRVVSVAYLCSMTLKSLQLSSPLCS